MPAWLIPIILAGISAGSKLFEKKPSTKQLPTMSPEQQGLQSNIINMLQGQLGEGGPFQKSQSFLGDIFSNEPGAFEKFAAPYQREFQEKTIPGLAERFSGGFGIPGAASAQSSSAFTQALGQAGAGLQENLAALRSGIQMKALPFAQQGLSQFFGPAFQSRFATGMKGGTPGWLAEALAPVLQGYGSSFGQNLGQQGFGG